MPLPLLEMLEAHFTRTCLLKVGDCGLDGRDLVAAKPRADDVQPRRQRGIAKSAIRLTREGGTGWSQ
jgi:hypothetical protein